MGLATSPLYITEKTDTNSEDMELSPFSIMEREDKDTFETDPFLNGDSDFDPEW